MTDRILNWHSHHDERSLNFPIRAAIGESVERKTKYWGSPGALVDQGSEGACVGFGWINELLASPRRVRLEQPDAFALDVYREARRIDEWPGEDYDGTSVLAGAKVIKSLGYIAGYRWAFGIDDVVDTLCALARDGGGPVVIGIPWFESMYETRPGGLVEVDGAMVGGHCITLTGYHPHLRIGQEGWNNRFEVVRWRNSWGGAYGRRGDGYIRVENLAYLLSSEFGAEACVPHGRVSSV